MAFVGFFPGSHVFAYGGWRDLQQDADFGQGEDAVLFVGLLEYPDTGFLFEIAELGSIGAVEDVLRFDQIDDDGLQLGLIHAFAVGGAFAFVHAAPGCLPGTPVIGFGEELVDHLHEALH